MSCEDFVITPGGRSGIGVNQPQSGLDYPLIAPSADIRYLIADFYLAYDDPGYYRATVERRLHPLRIKWLYGVGCEPAAKPAWAPDPVHTADILVVDENDDVAFDSTKLVPSGGDSSYQSFQQINWGDDLVIYEWIGNHAVCRLVVYRAWPSSFEIEPRHWPVHIAPENATLDERAVYKMPRRVRSLRVADSGFTSAYFRRRGAVFATGYNMRIESSETTNNLRTNTDITFHAEPGAGIGKYDNCSDEAGLPIKGINGATPNAYGDFTLSGPDCIWIRQPTQLQGSRAAPLRYGNAPTLMIGTNCTPCCDCPDYVETGLYMNRVARRYATIGKSAHSAKILHEGNIDRWMEQRDCRLAKPLRVQLVPQNCPEMDVVIMYCNQCQRCAEDVTLMVDFSTFPGGASAELVCGYTFLYAPDFPGLAFTLTGSYPTFSAQLPPINIGNSAYVKFRLKFTPKTTPYAVTATLTGTKNGSPILAGCDNNNPPAQAVFVDALNCGSDGTSIPNCNVNP